MCGVRFEYRDAEVGFSALYVLVVDLKYSLSLILMVRTDSEKKEFVNGDDVAKIYYSLSLRSAPLQRQN